MTAPKVQLSPADMDRLSQLMYQLSHNDKTRPVVAQLVAHVDPGSAKAFTDVHMQQQLVAFKQQLDNEKLQERMAGVQHARESQKQAVIRKRGYGAAQVAELEKIQSQYGLTDWIAAADIYATRNPPENPALQPPPEHLDGSTWDFPTVPGPDGKMLAFKDYVQDPRRYSNKTAYQMITEFKRGRLPSAFHG